MASYTIDILPNPAPDHDTLLEYSSRLKTLRLRSLKEDAKGFISKYESEFDEPEDFWLNRLQSSRAIHLILGRNNHANTNATLMQKDWVGFVVIIAPAREGIEDKTRPASGEWEMAALYVEPEARGQGHGKRLVEATIDYVKTHGFVDGIETPCCLTSVRHGNDDALRLYQSLGFRIIDPKAHVEKEGRDYLTTNLRLDLHHDQ